MKKHPHSMTYRLLNYAVCSKCGLIALKNKRTRKALRKPCPGTPDDE